MGQASGPETDLCDLEARVLLVEGVCDRDPYNIIPDLGMTDPATLDDSFAAQMGDVPDNLDALGVGRHEDKRTALVGVGLLVGAGHHQQDVGLAPAGRPPLVTVDDPLVPVLFGGGLEHLRIRSTPL